MTREEFEKFLEEINEAECVSPHFVEDEVKSWDEHKPEKVMQDLDMDEHRWYVISTTVYKVGEWFFGIEGVIGLKSESMEYIDCKVDTEAFEMVEVPSVTYKRPGAISES